MCGFAGVLDPSLAGAGEKLEVLVASMAEAVAHRGPDDAGVASDPGAGVAVGFRRLAILDLSAAGHQPMWSRCGRFLLVYNGELYNHAELRRDLEAGGRRFRGHSDTEVLIEAISAWGLWKTLLRSNGMFALAVWDRDERTMRLARDRLGEKPLYYGRLRGGVGFASELVALRAHPAFRPEIDRDAVAMFLRHGYIPAPYTIFRDVWKVPQGSLVTIDGEGRTDVATYWSMRDVAAAALADRLTEESEAVDALDELLLDAVGLRMEADVPLGAFLSGGIDSSTVVALMQAQAREPVRTFAIGFSESAFDEAPAARRVAAHLGTDHTELYVSARDALEVVPSLPFLYDEPFADVSQIPTALVCRLARRHVTVALSGDGGDELFAGYPWYLENQAPLRADRLPQPVTRPVASLLARRTEDQWDTLWHRLARPVPALARRRPGARLRQYGRQLASRDARSRHATRLSRWRSPDEVVLGAHEHRSLLLDRSQWPPFDLVEWMMYLDSMLFLADDILVKVDRAAMAVGLETRVPLLDPRVVELAWRMPLKMKVAGGSGKQVLRQVLARYVPGELFDRPKQGFSVPMAEWLRGPLKTWADELLSPSCLAEDELLEPGAVRAAWARHLEGGIDHSSRLWAVLMLQAWREAQHDGSSPTAESPACGAGSQ